MHEPSDIPRDAIAAVTHSDPYPWYATLVATRPFHRDDNLNLWVAASADAVATVLQSPACQVRPITEPVPKHLGDGAAASVFRLLVRMRDDGQREAARRLLLQRLGTLATADVKAIADRVMAALHNEGSPVDDLLFSLPVRSMAALLGLPAELQAEAVRRTGDYVRCLAPQATPAQIASGNEAAGILLDLVATHCTLLPGRDDAMPANALGLLMQSHDATAGLIGNALVTLHRHPDLERRLRAEPALMPDFIAEMMRFDPPVQNSRRFVAQDARIFGHHLRQGDAILVLLAAASRDPAAYDEPHSFRLDRPRHAPIGFGHGRHACAGPEIALTVAAAGIQYWVNHGLAIPTAVGYRPSANARIPFFTRQ